MQAAGLFPCLIHHVRRVIQTGNVRLRQRLVNRHGQNAGSHRYLKQPAGEMLRNARQCLFEIIVTFLLVHIPHQTAYRFSAQCGAGDHAVIKIIAARHSVCAANGFFPIHIHSSVL